MIDLLSIAIDLANGDYEPIIKEPDMKAGPKQQQIRALAKRRHHPAAKPPTKRAAPKAEKVANPVVLFRQFSKQRLIYEMLSAPGGTTEAEILERLGWVKCRVTVKRVCDRAGKPLQKREKNGETIWFV